MKEPLEERIDRYQQDHYLSGNIHISKEGKTLFCKSYGQASIQLGVSNKKDTKFHIASVTKMFIAAATLKLYEQGLISLDDHPGTYVDAFKALHPKITIHHLLSHSSGLHDIYAVPDLTYEMSKLRMEKRAFMPYLVGLKQNFFPGERWEYSSTGFIMLGYILEAVTEMEYEEILNSWFFSPLHMESTGVDCHRQINSGRAYGHAWENNQLINADNDRLSTVQAPGELYSTVQDLNTWCEALFKGDILQPETMDKMFAPYYTTTFDPNLNYGYGWFLGADFRLIAGGTPGFRSEIWHYPVQDLRIVMLWNYEKVDSHQLFRMIKPLLFHS